jgi:predicted deacylase
MKSPSNKGISNFFIEYYRSIEGTPRGSKIVYINSGIVGPTVTITSGIHGDEVGGVAISHDLIRYLQERPLIKGSVRIIPISNPFGFEESMRHITIDDEDLNRNFPGSENGTLSERIARKLLNIVKGSDLHIDVHNDWGESIPYIVIDRNPNANTKLAHSKAIKFAKKSGLLIVDDIVPVAEGQKTFTFNVLKSKIPSFTIESGQSKKVYENNVHDGLQGILNILSSLGMVDDYSTKFNHSKPKKSIDKVLEFDESVSPTKSGLLRSFVLAGDSIKKGQIIGKVYNDIGDQIEEIRATRDGVLMSAPNFSAVTPGTKLFSIACYTKEY